MKPRAYIATIGTLLAFIVGIFVPSTAAAWESCTDVDIPAPDPFESVDFFQTNDSTRMSLKVEKSAEPVADQPDCSTVDQRDESDPAYAACYDSVDLPISTIPSLFAEHQAETASGSVLGRVSEILGKSVEEPVVDPEPSEASVEFSPAERLRRAWRAAAQSLPKNEAACSVSAPDTCRSAPALPSLMIPEVSSPSASESFWSLEVEPPDDGDYDAAPLTDVAHLSSRVLDVPKPPPRA